MQAGAKILRTRLDKEKQMTAQVEARRKANAQEEAGRTHTALLQYRDDRLRKQNEAAKEKERRQIRRTHVETNQTNVTS